MGSLFGSIFQPRTRIIENRDDHFSGRGITAAVVLLSNFEAIRSSNLDSRVGPPYLVRKLKSGTGTPGGERGKGSGAVMVGTEAGGSSGTLKQIPKRVVLC